MIKKITTVILFTMFTATSYGQLTGTKNIPGNYATLALAIQDLNTVGVGAGGVTLNLLSGNPQIAPAGGYSITAEGTATNTISIVGNSNTITSSPAHTVGSVTDAIFKIVGGDYITLSGFVLEENAANTAGSAAASNNMTEWGVAMLRVSVTNGAQYNTIQNNTISLDKSYSNTMGVYISVRHSSTNLTTSDITNNTTAPNHHNNIHTNTISDVNTGIIFAGSVTAAYMDDGNISNGNSIANYGGLFFLTTYPGVSYQAIACSNQINYTVNNNTITGSFNLNTIVYGIYHSNLAVPVGTVVNNITNNVISISQASSSTFTVIAISNTGSASPNTDVIQNITNNTIENSTISSPNIFGITSNNGYPIKELNINGNIFKNITITSGSFTGVENNTAVWSSININNNQMGNSTGGAVTFTSGSSGFIGLRNLKGGPAAALSMSSNNFQGIDYQVPATGSITLLSAGFAVLSQNISSNTFTNLNINSTGFCSFIANDILLPAGGTSVIDNNRIVTGFSMPGATGVTIYFTTNIVSSSPAGTIKYVRNNNFSNINAGGGYIRGWWDQDGTTGNIATKIIDNNTFSNWTTTGDIVTIETDAGDNSSISGNTISGMSSANYKGISVSLASGALTCSNNTISTISYTPTSTPTLFNTGGSAPQTIVNVNGNTVHGVSSTNAYGLTGITVVSGTTVNVMNNKIYNLQSASGSVSGISVSGGSTARTIINNYIGDLRVGSANSINSLVGLQIFGSGPAYVYHNTVYLNASSSGANFGSYGINLSTTPDVTLRNNLVVNTSIANGIGRTVAYQRSSTTLTTYNAASDNNSFYAGVPSATNVIYGDGTNTDQTLAAFKTRMGTRDVSSLTVNPVFASTDGSSASFLHIAAGTTSSLESGGGVIAGVTVDYDNDARPGPAGSINGGGTLPDIGADEFDGIPACHGSPTAGTATVSSAVCGSGTFDLSATGYSTQPGITYQWKSSATSGGSYAAIAGATTTPYTTASISATMYYVYETTCVASGVSILTNEVTATVKSIPSTPTASSNSPVCEGNTINLSTTAVAGATYAWTGPASFSSSVQNPSRTSSTTAMDGTYSLTVTVNGCTSSAGTTTVVVNAIPSTPTASSNSPVCEGSDIILFAATAPGAYAWTGPDSFSSTNEDPFRTSSTTAMDGTYSVTVTVNGCTSSAGTTTVVVNAIPSTPTVSSNSPVCEGSTINLSTTAVAGATYAWAGSDSFNSSVQNPSRTSSTTAMDGTYSLTVTVNGCTSSAGTTDVIVNSIPSTPTASSNSSVCEGSDINLSTTAVAGATYAWAGPDSFSSSDQNPSRTSSTTAMDGTYSLTVTVNGCTSSAGTTVVVVNSIPSTPTAFSNSPVCEGSTINLSTATVSGAAYAWTGPDSFSSTDQNPSRTSSTTAMDGIYSLTVTVNGCTSSAGTVDLQVNVCTSIIASSAMDEIQVYPNPVQSKFTIERTNSSEKMVTVKILNNIGVVVKTFDMTSSSQQIDMSWIESGMYSVCIESDNSVKVIRLIKE